MRGTKHQEPPTFTHSQRPQRWRLVSEPAAYPCYSKTTVNTLCAHAHLTLSVPQPPAEAACLVSCLPPPLTTLRPKSRVIPDAPLTPRAVLPAWSCRWPSMEQVLVSVCSLGNRWWASWWTRPWPMSLKEESLVSKIQLNLYSDMVYFTCTRPLSHVTSTCRHTFPTKLFSLQPNKHEAVDQSDWHSLGLCHYWYDVIQS